AGLYRQFLKTTLIGGISMIHLSSCAGLLHRNNKTPSYGIQTDIPARLYDGKQCWIHSRVGIVPGAGVNGMPRTVMTMNTHEVVSSDIFKQMVGMYSNDLGHTWTDPKPLDELKPHWVM